MKLECGRLVSNFAFILNWRHYTKLLRVSAEDEDTGLDESHHGGAAYNFETGKVAAPAAV